MSRRCGRRVGVDHGSALPDISVDDPIPLTRSVNGSSGWDISFRLANNLSGIATTLLLFASGVSVIKTSSLDCGSTEKFRAFTFGEVHLRFLSRACRCELARQKEDDAAVNDVNPELFPAELKTINVSGNKFYQQTPCPPDNRRGTSGFSNWLPEATTTQRSYETSGPAHCKSPSLTCASVPKKTRRNRDRETHHSEAQGREEFENVLNRHFVLPALLTART
jgi:hypothetical protein